MRRLIATAALAMLASVAPAAVAADGAPSTVCPASEFVQPYAAFGDQRDYVLAPDGSFESPSGDGWSLRKRAEIVEGNGPILPGAAGEARSLELSPGGSAISQPMCVDLNYPTFRLSVRALDPEGQPDLEIEVRYPDAQDDSWNKVRTESGTSEEGWRITSDIDLKPDTFSSALGARDVQIRFRATGKSGAPGWQLDDVFVDPRCF